MLTVAVLAHAEMMKTAGLDLLVISSVGNVFVGVMKIVDMAKFVIILAIVRSNLVWRQVSAKHMNVV